MAARPLDGHVAFEVTLHADRISPLGRQLYGINHHRIDHRRINRRRSFCVSGIGYVSRSGSVAALTANAILGEKGRRVFVLRALHWRLHAAGVALQATGVGRQIHGDFACVSVGWSHVPDFAIGVPVDGRLEKEIIHSEQIAAATAARTDEVKQLPLVVYGRISRALETQPDFFAFGVNLVVPEKEIPAIVVLAGNDSNTAEGTVN